MKYKIAETIEECNKCDELLTELIKFEYDYDHHINRDFSVKNFYNRILNNEHGVIFIALDGEEIVGYIIALREHTKGTSFNTNIVRIDGLFIQEKYRHQNIGTTLIDLVDKWAYNKYTDYTLEISVINTNINAVKCYTKLGFTPFRTTLRRK